MARFRELRQTEMQEFLQAFSLPGTPKYRNNKWVGLNSDGRPFTVHVKHGSTRKFPPQLVESVAKDLDGSAEEFTAWHEQ